MSELQTLTYQGQRVAIISGLRTPFARQCSQLKEMNAIEMGTLVVNELLARTEIPVAMIDQLIFGQVVQMPSAPNIAREMVLSSNLDDGTDGFSLSKACTTSLQALISATESILCGATHVAIVGGADSTSNLPFGLSHALGAALIQSRKQPSLLRKMSLFRHLSLRDWRPVPPPIAEYSTGKSMGETAEQMAKTFHISREEQDAFAHRSHQRAAAAWQAHCFDHEVMPLYPKPYHECVVRDNIIREDSELASYARLRPVFDRKFGSVTAGNSSQLTDGAAAILLMREDVAKAHGFPVLGYIKAYATASISVEQNMLMGPAYVMPKVLKRAGIALDELQLIEMHEAFSAQVLANLQMFESLAFANEILNQTRPIGAIDMDKFNVLGGSIAYGHPFAATGARLITQLVHELNRRAGGLGMATACAAGGLAAAVILEVTDD